LKFDDKKKTLRIRNELAAELDTEIKVCEEKINDANADQNQKEKYKLMRLRDKLVAERTRVRTNSKYI
jgi:F0F1-type ATP synthase assembly protein I